MICHMIGVYYNHTSLVLISIRKSSWQIWPHTFIVKIVVWRRCVCRISLIRKGWLDLIPLSSGINRYKSGTFWFMLELHSNSYMRFVVAHLNHTQLTTVG